MTSTGTLAIALVAAAVSGTMCSAGAPPGVVPAAQTPTEASSPAPPVPTHLKQIVWTSTGTVTEGSFTARIDRHSVDVEGTLTELSFATLERGGRVLMTFDGVTYPLGNETRIAFARLVDSDPVLLVEQEAYRDWRIWIVRLSPRVRTIFDSAEWGVGQGLVADDLDGDGSAELVQVSLHYWFFDRFNNVNSPFPQVVFAFDPVSGRYVPAVSRFPQHAAREIDRLKRKVAEQEAAADDPWKSDNVLGSVAEVVVTLCYLGRGDEAWEYFDQHDLGAEHAARRRKLRRHIADDPILRAVAASPPGKRTRRHTRAARPSPTLDAVARAR